MRKTLIELRGNRSQEEVAKGIGINQQFISRMEQGIATPSIRVLARMMKYFQATPQELFPDIFNP